MGLEKAASAGNNPLAAAAAGQLGKEPEAPARQLKMFATRLPVDLIGRLKPLSLRTNRSVQDIVTDILEKGVQREEDKLDRKQQKEERKRRERDNT